MAENRPRYNYLTFCALKRTKPHLCVRDATGIWWTRGARGDDVPDARIFRWEYMVPPGTAIETRPREGWVHLPLDDDPELPLPFLVRDHFQETPESSRERGGPPRGEGMERARGRKTAFSRVCGAVNLEYFPDQDVSDRSRLAQFALRRHRDYE